MIVEAHRRGWRTDCLYYETDLDPSAGKNRQHPKFHKIPKEIARCSRPVQFRDSQEFSSLIGNYDVVFSHYSWSLRSQSQFFPALNAPPRNTKWAHVQVNFDTFEYTHEKLLEADFNLLISPYWSEVFAHYAEEYGWPPDSPRKFNESSLFVGAPGMDVYGHLDRVEIRRRYGIPEDRPIVLCISSIIYHRRSTPWAKYVYAAPSRPRMLWNVVSKLRDTCSLGHAVRGWNYINVLNKIRKFCDNNNAVFIMKGREKDRYLDIEKNIPDLYLTDTSYYPPTFLELLSVSDLVIGNFSGVVMDVVTAGVPYLLIDLPKPGRHPRSSLIERFENEDPSFWRCEGAIWRLDLETLLNDFPNMRLKEFAVDAAARSRYVERIMGTAGGSASARALDAVSERIAASAGREPTTPA